MTVASRIICSLSLSPHSLSPSLSLFRSLTRTLSSLSLSPPLPPLSLPLSLYRVYSLSLSLSLSHTHTHTHQQRQKQRQRDRNIEIVIRTQIVSAPLSGEVWAFNVSPCNAHFSFIPSYYQRLPHKLPPKALAKRFCLSSLHGPHRF